jgi:hypothetical protein
MSCLSSFRFGVFVHTNLTMDKLMAYFLTTFFLLSPAWMESHTLFHLSG